MTATRNAGLGAGFGAWLVAGLVAWLAFLAIGTAFYFVAGRNSFYFQFRAEGLKPEDARIEAAKLGQQIFPAGSTLDSLCNAAKVWKTWLLVAIYFTTFGGFMARSLRMKS